MRAAGLHIADCFATTGSPFPIRVSTGLLKPKLGIPGYDVAGVVESAGANVTRFAPGDEVFGTCEGSCADFVATSQEHLALKLESLTFEEAAAIPTSGLAALHGLRAGKLKSGQHVLIVGAAGGVGHFAVQIAKALGAEVSGVSGTANVDFVRSLGADHVIDYTHEDFTQAGRRYDLIFDNVERRSMGDTRRALKEDGTLVLNSGTGNDGLAMVIRLAAPVVISPFVKQTLKRFLSSPNHADLVVLKEMAEANQLRPHIERTYTLEQVPEALHHIASGHARGKQVVVVR